MIRELLLSFVGQIQREYPHVIFRFEYDSREESYRIWHTSYKPDEEETFLSSMGRLIKELFIANNFYNFYLDFNAEYDDKINKASQWSKTENNCNKLKATWTSLPMNQPFKQALYTFAQLEKLCNKDMTYLVKNRTRGTQSKDAKEEKAA